MDEEAAALHGRFEEALKLASDTEVSLRRTLERFDGVGGVKTWDDFWEADYVGEINRAYQKSDLLARAMRGIYETVNAEVWERTEKKYSTRDRISMEMIAYLESEGIRTWDDFTTSERVREYYGKVEKDTETEREEARCEWSLVTEKVRKHFMEEA